MYYPCCNPCGIRDWIGCATAPSSREKGKEETPWLYPHWQWPRSLGNATHCSGKFSWREHSSIITEVFLNWKEAYKCHGFLSALSNPSEYGSLSHLAHMPENPQIIQPGFSCDAGFHHLQRVCTAAGGGKQLQEACHCSAPTGASWEQI